MFGALPLSAGGLAAAAAAALGSGLPLVLKAAGELHRGVFLTSDVLARQGESVPTLPGTGKRLERQRGAGIRGGVSRRPGEAPGYLEKVPRRPRSGDLRREYEPGGLGAATSSKGNIDDILAKVPDRGSYGTDEYKRIARPVPKRAGGFGNQSFSP